MEVLLASDQGLETLLQIRHDPVTFCRKIYPTDTDDNSAATLGALVSELLKALYSEIIPVAVKVHIVNVLSEECVALFEGTNSVDIAVVQLTDVFQKNPSGGNAYRSSILIAITNLILVHDQKERSPDLFKDFVGLLLDLISRVNLNADRHVRSCACDCLMEMELEYPGLLLKKLEHFYQMARLENTTAFQSYLLLFARTFLDAARWVTRQVESDDRGKLLADLLTKRTEPLKPLSMDTSQAPVVITDEALSVQRLKIAEDGEVATAVKYIMDSCSLLVPAAQSMLLATVSCLCGLLTFSSSKAVHESLAGLSRRAASSFDLQFYGAVLNNRIEESSGTGDDSASAKGDSAEQHGFSTTDCRINRTLCSIISDPDAPAAERMLCCDWLPRLLHVQGLLTSADAGDRQAKEVVRDALRAATPSPFDGWQLQVKKLLALSKLVKSQAFSGLRSVWLVGTLRALRKQWLHESALLLSSRGSDALFFLLLRILLDHGESDEELVHDVQQSIYSLVAESPELTPQALWLIKNLKAKKPGSALPHQLLDDLLDLANSLPADALFAGMQHYAATLCEGAGSTQLHRLRRLLTKLMEGVRATQSPPDVCWRIGNQLLDVCHRCLCRRDCKATYVELGELLYTAATEHPNVCVRERAQLYYASLISLSAEKIRDVLEHKDGIAYLMTGDVSFRIAPPVARVKDVFAIEKLGRVVRWPAGSAVSGDASAYGPFLADNGQPTIDLHCRLTMLPNEITSEAFAIVIGLSSSSASVLAAPVKDVTIDAMDIDDCSCQEFSAEIKLAYSTPFALDKLSVTFSCSQASTYATAMKPIRLSVEDIVCNLPVQTRELFDILWNDLLSRLSLDSSDRTVLSMTHFLNGRLLAEHLFSVAGRLHAYAMPGPACHSGGAPDSKDVETPPLRAAFFLHPNRHVLLKISFIDDDANVELLADDFHCVDLVNRLLKTCFAGEAPS